MAEMLTEKVVYGHLILPDRVRDGGLWIRGEQIVEVIAPDRVIPGVEVYDYRDQYILPGLIEVHGHMREPGLSDKEDYPHGTRAALAGGVTTIFDMPNTNPPTTTIARLREKEAIAAGRAYCDYAMFFGGARDNQAEIATLDPHEVVGVKFFMAGHETTPTTVTDLGDLYAGLQAMQGKGLVALFHAENQQLINRLSAEMRAAGRDDGRAYSQSRGPIVAEMAVAEAARLAAELDIPAYICHVSTRGELVTIAQMRRLGAAIYAEAVGYHLTFTEDNYESLGAWIKVSPPVREPIERENLWEAFAGEEVDTLASEHTPHTRADKERPMNEAASGMPGIQENLPMVVTQYRQRYPEKPLDDIIRHVALLGSTNIARIFGVEHRKGALVAGKDADFTVLDPNQSWTIREADLFSKCGWSAYAGRTTSCRITATFLRGERVYADGAIIGEPSGRLLRSQASSGFGPTD